MIRRRTFSLALVPAVVTAACTAAPSTATRHVDFTTAHYTSSRQLAASSEYAVLATVTSPARPYTLAAEPVLRYWVASATVTKVIAQRPDVAVRLTPGMSIPVGTELLDEQQKASIANWSDLVTEVSPESDAPRQGDQVLAFLVASDLAGFGKGYEAVGQATVASSGVVTYRALPGSLSHTSGRLSDAIAGVTADMAKPAPWRAVDPSTGTPAVTGPPASSPAR